MWRGYGGDGNGVAIVFDMSRLLATTELPLLVRQVQYLSYDESEAWMDRKLADFARALARLEVPLERMPAAQLLSMPQRAANPPSEAPYPTDVGTATMGVPSRPPTTLGSAPSMPATTMTAGASAKRASSENSR